MKKVIVSACILGDKCRYDGKTKEIKSVIKAFEGYEIIPFCPEAPLFGTPRERINVIEVNGENRIITDITNIDVTWRLEEEIASFIKSHKDVDAIVLKSKSPSCGSGTTPILNAQKDVIKFGSGIAVKMFETEYKHIAIKDENFYLE